MAKLTGPLFSLGASQKLGNTLVFFPWKGLNCVRQYVIPANPQSSGQTTQRGYLTTIVQLIHDVQALGANGLKAVDVTAYALYATTIKSALTWFNAVVRQSLTQKVASLRYAVYYDWLGAPGANQIVPSVKWYKEGGAPNDITAGNFHYGTSKTALVNVAAATVVGALCDATIAGLTTGVKYYVQFRATAHADYVGTRSGIYHLTPT